MIVTVRQTNISVYSFASMDSRILIPFRFLWFLTFVVCVLTPMVESQIQGCSFQDIDLGLCLNQVNNSSSIDGTCCEVLNKIAQIGYNCLCLLVISSVPLLSTPLSLPLPDCSIYVPPLTLCRVLAPMPIVFPPSSPKELIQPSLPPKDVFLSPPPHEMQVPLNSTDDDNSTIVAAQPPSIDNLVPKLFQGKKENQTSNRSDKTNIMLLKSLFPSLAFHGWIFLA